VPGPDLLARELLQREVAEEPHARAARLAHGRWITHLRLWAAMDREDIVEPGEQARFICARLWPDLREEVVGQFAETVRRHAAAGRPLRRPTHARDVVGDDLERLLLAYGYDVEPRAGSPR
jgi:hypothetical protein